MAKRHRLNRLLEAIGKPIQSIGEPVIQAGRVTDPPGLALYRARLDQYLRREGDETKLHEFTPFIREALYPRRLIDYAPNGVRVVPRANRLSLFHPYGVAAAVEPILCDVFISVRDNFVEEFGGMRATLDTINGKLELIKSRIAAQKSCIRSRALFWQAYNLPFHVSTSTSITKNFTLRGGTQSFVHGVADKVSAAWGGVVAPGDRVLCVAAARLRGIYATTDYDVPEIKISPCVLVPWEFYQQCYADALRPEFVKDFKSALAPRQHPLFPLCEDHYEVSTAAACWMARVMDGEQVSDPTGSWRALVERILARSSRLLGAKLEFCNPVLGARARIVNGMHRRKKQMR